MIDHETINEVVKRLVGVYNPEKIYLFGSYAWGTPNEDSDLDLLVVVNESNEKSHRRTIPGIHALWGLEIAKDLLVYTQQEFNDRVSYETTLVHKVGIYGKVLYVRS